MATNSGVPILYKPFGSPTSSNAGRVTIATAADAKAVDIVDANGNVISGSRKDTARHIPEPGAIPGPYNQNWWAGSPNDIPAGSLIRVTNADGSYSYAKITNPYQGYRGFVNEGEGDKPSDAAVLPVNTHAEGGMGVPNGFAPGQFGQFGSFPAYLGSMFPQAVLAQYQNIQAAPYKFTDPLKYAQAFGEANRGEIQKNFNLSSDLALKEMNTELAGLQNFVPAASALKRNETSLDNQFNQQQRLQQINQVLPNAVGDLNAQRDRAVSYASGNIPDSTQNAAFELGIRSASADRAAAGGFGATSSVARKASDLMSAQERIGLSKYGDQLLSNNINQRANLLLSPTEYSNAGGQINVNPSLSASQLINSNLNAINGLTTITPTTGLQSTVGQNQFQTNLQQQTNQFNASNQLQTSIFNAGQQNGFALDKFGYQAAYANNVSNAQQTDINTNFMLQQQQMMAQLMSQYLSQAQNSGLLNSLSNLGGGFLNNLLGGSSSITGKGGGKNGGFFGGSGSPGDITPGGVVADFGNAIDSAISAPFHAISSIF